jgi:diacylglycerol kinase family enzyme
VFLSNHQGPAATPKLLASMIAGRVHHDLDIESATCSMLDVETKYLTLDVGLDGEVRTLEPPLHFQAHRRGLRVLAPTP